MKLVTVVGARPQFVKASVVSKAIARHPSLTEVILHTGQHFDANMSDLFFQQLGIPRPDYLLDIHGGSHGSMTGRMLIEVEQVLMKEHPDRVLVYGDTNSTLAGALAAAKLHIPVAHVEAGLRSFNMRMPEEINRILTDQISDILFCPTDAAVGNLKSEGFNHKPARIIKVGDVMQDSALLFAPSASRPAAVEHDGGFILATLHRAENTDDPHRLRALVAAINGLHKTCAPVICPLHPRTREAIARLGMTLGCNVIEPVGYLAMLWLLQHCELVLTDSGGVQKEAYFFGRFCITLRDQTEWIELVKIGANALAGADTEAILRLSREKLGTRIANSSTLYGGGSAAAEIARELAAEHHG
jgi:UDP-GlcNAc3NAcA epimerase